MKITFVAEVTISMNVTAEGETIEECIQKAQNAPMQSLCWQCSHGEEDEWSTSGEFDGEPKPLEVVCDDPKVAKKALRLWKNPPKKKSTFKL